MPEYIDRDHYCKYICRCNGDKCEKTKCPIFTAPTADVAPVVHGKWQMGESGCMYFCSECELWVFPRESREWNYCPNCGAKMDGGKENG